jgi:hypothetical protein
MTESKNGCFGSTGGSQKMVEEYWLNGNLKSRSFLLNDVAHNPNGPALEEWYEDGRNKTRAFAVNGKHHNPNGPALEDWYEDGSYAQAFYIHGQCHNTLGPALAMFEKDGRVRDRKFYIHDRELTEDEFLARGQTKSAGKQ